MPAVALLLIDNGQVEQAVELYTLATRHSYVANSVWFEDAAGKQIAAAVAQERGRALDWWETAEALLTELDW